MLFAISVKLGNVLDFYLLVYNCVAKAITCKVKLTKVQSSVIINLFPFAKVMPLVPNSAVKRAIKQEFSSVANKYRELFCHVYRSRRKFVYGWSIYIEETNDSYYLATSSRCGWLAWTSPCTGRMHYFLDVHVRMYGMLASFFRNTHMYVSSPPFVIP